MLSPARIAAIVVPIVIVAIVVPIVVLVTKKNKKAAQDCEMNAWGAWGACSTTCDPGTQTRSRSVATPAANGGKACGNLTETETCNEGPNQACPIKACQVGDWTAWSACTDVCGGGTQTRSRTVTSNPSNVECGALTDTQTCNTQTCPPEACQLSDWTAWDDCSKDCGGGTQTRSRTITSNPSNSPCGALNDSQGCNTQACPCQLSDWTAWGDCSKDCGGGTQTRSRTVVSNPSNVECGALTNSQVCNTQACPTDPWTPANGTPQLLGDVWKTVGGGKAVWTYGTAEGFARVLYS